jgi:arginyl-tRNA synthetase
MTDTIYTAIRARVIDALLAAVPGLAPELAARVEVTPTRDPAHGDLATNAALIAAKPARQAPARLAAALAEALASAPEVASAEPAGPGFVNIRLRPAALLAVLPTILRTGEAYGDATTGQGQRVNIEYVSANPNGPMHVGHCRGAIVGDSLANLLAKAGWSVTKEFYVNDAGNQIIALAWVVYWRYLQALGTTLTEAAFAAATPGGLQYPGEYLIPLGAALAAEHGDRLAGPGLTIAPPATWFALVRDFSVSTMLGEIRDDLAVLGVKHDVFTSERALLESGATDAAIATLQADGLIYEGTLEPPKGKLPDDWEPREQTLFRSTQFGDDVDRPLRKSDGTNTYFANDIAYHADKAARGAQVMIDVWGADHGGYVSRMKAATTAITHGAVKLDVVVCQIVRVLKGGEPVKMSKRAGTFITLRDLLDEVGRDAVRFTMLTRKADAQMDFDIDAAVAQTRENPVFYVQYAHARCKSVLRAAAEMPGLTIDPAALAEADLTSLADPAELALVLRLAGWPRMVEQAAEAREPHRIAFFLYDLAADFHMLWNRGRDAATLRFLQPDRPAETLARLALVEATAIVIRSGLAVMGVEARDELR